MTFSAVPGAFVLRIVLFCAIFLRGEFERHVRLLCIGASRSQSSWSPLEGGFPVPMLSYGEILLTLAAAAALFGPKDIPIVARAAGRLVGRAVGYIQSARGQVDNVMKRSQVDQVHRELQETLGQLDAIRYEIRSGMSISKPGPMTRSVSNIDLKPAPPQTDPIKEKADVRDAASSPSIPNRASDTQRDPLSETQILHQITSHEAVLPSNTGEFQTMSKVTTVTKPISFQRGPDGTFDTMPPSTRRASAERIVLKPVDTAPPPAAKGSLGTGQPVQDIVVLPISAVSVGLLPSRTGPSEGSDLVVESLTERKVALDTKSFFEQGDVNVRY